MRALKTMISGAALVCSMMTASLGWAATADSTGTVEIGGLVVLMNAGCLGAGNGPTDNWDSAKSRVNLLASSNDYGLACNLKDGSKAGAWRLPNKTELQSIFANKSLLTNFFAIGSSSAYWTNEEADSGKAWLISNLYGTPNPSTDRKIAFYGVLAVRRK